MTLCEMLGHHFEWKVLVRHESYVERKICSRCGEEKPDADSQ